MRPQPSPRRFAAALAERLNKVVPAGLAVRARGAGVNISGATMLGASIIDADDGRSIQQLVEGAARAILDGVQDVVMETTTEEWPVGPDGKVAEAGARIDENQLLLWFGDENTPVIVFPPIPLDEIFEGAA